MMMVVGYSNQPLNHTYRKLYNDDKTRIKNKKKKERKKKIQAKDKSSIYCIIKQIYDPFVN